MIGRCGITVLLILSACAAEPLPVPFFEQEKNGCGAAAIAMVVHYWRAHSPDQNAITPSPQQVYQRLYRGDARGILLADMKSYLEALGFHAFTFRGRWAEVEGNLEKGRPMIVGLKKRRTGTMHFAVITGTDGNHVWLNDPTRGKVNKVGQHKFNKEWELADRWVLLAAPATAD